MREIKFKGKTGGEWATTAVGDPDWVSFWASVDRDTVVQYIGATDRNNVDIFEGDIVRYLQHQGEVRWARGCYEIAWTVHGGDRSTLNRHIESWQPAEDFVVVGSVFENPEPRGS